ncbi:MAG: HAD-IIIA family hydrolase [Chitinophagaceae bacterium]|nr:HAD-IIIA family hydrolase [Chitinophagaceae bacterium]MCB9046191.1 HAD-IIIA family hydrolase [Chitinophagales bacterium]
MNVLELFAPVKTFVFDVDGVLTNSQLLAMEDGSLLRSVNIKDGYALQLAIKKGYHIWIISGGTSEAIKKRFEKLGLEEVHIAVKDKKAVLQELAAKHNIALEHTLYMGDDMPDYEVMQMCGLPTCPADACPEIKNISKYVSPVNGGMGCVRDVVEKVLKLNGHWAV